MVDDKRKLERIPVDRLPEELHNIKVKIQTARSTVEVDATVSDANIMGIRFRLDKENYQKVADHLREGTNVSITGIVGDVHLMGSIMHITAQEDGEKSYGVFLANEYEFDKLEKIIEKTLDN